VAACDEDGTIKSLQDLVWLDPLRGVILPCGHAMHAQCLLEQVEKARTNACPMCKQHIVKCVDTRGANWYSHDHMRDDMQLAANMANQYDGGAAGSDANLRTAALLVVTLVASFFGASFLGA
jgi:hypothetical protein